jgi:hypothetical protein
MSKETKFLSIAIGLLQGFNADKGKTDPVTDKMNADCKGAWYHCLAESGH